MRYVDIFMGGIIIIFTDFWVMIIRVTVDFPLAFANVYFSRTSVQAVVGMSVENMDKLQAFTSIEKQLAR